MTSSTLFRMLVAPSGTPLALDLLDGDGELRRRWSLVGPSSDASIPPLPDRGLPELGDFVFTVLARHRIEPGLAYDQLLEFDRSGMRSIEVTDREPDVVLSAPPDLLVGVLTRELGLDQYVHRGGGVRGDVGYLCVLAGALDCLWERAGERSEISCG